MPVVLLVASTAIIGSLLVSVGWLVGGPKQAAIAASAGLYSVTIAAATLVLVLRVHHRDASLVVPAALLGVMVRGVSAVAAVVTLRGVVVAAGLSPTRFAEWVAAFYIVTLAIESAILVRVVGSGRVRATDGDRSAGIGR